MSRRIDVHHHFLFPSYVQAVNEQGDPSGWHVPEWTLELDQDFNKRRGISTSILTLTAPGPDLVTGPASSQLAREANERAAKIRDDHPQEYGFFASLPGLLNTEAALSELEYALDTLHADGVILLTRYGDANYYLGHEKFKPIWDELDKRNTVVFVHPTHQVDTNLVSEALPQPTLDYPHETTRTAVDLILSNTVHTHPNVKIILPHAGGTLPWLVQRPAALLSAAGKTQKSIAEFLEDARSFYFDLALSGNPLVVELLRKFAKPGHILYGSDFPYAPEDCISFFDDQLKEAKEAMSNEENDEIEFKNALALFPRLA